MVSLKEIDEVLSAYIQPQTYPLAVKMMSGPEEIPKSAKSPVRDYGALRNALLESSL